MLNLYSTKFYLLASFSSLSSRLDLVFSGDLGFAGGDGFTSFFRGRGMNFVAMLLPPSGALSMVGEKACSAAASRFGFVSVFGGVLVGSLADSSGFRSPYRKRLVGDCDPDLERDDRCEDLSNDLQRITR